MKKALLSMAAVAVCGVAFAATTTVNVTDFDKTSVEGTFVEKVDKADGSGVQAYAHYQPLEAVTIGGYEFNFSQGSNEKNAPALYDSKNSTWTIRLYYGNTMTIMAPAGESFGKVTFNTTNGAETFTCSVNAGNTKFNYTSSTSQSLEWANETPVNSLTLTVDANIRIESMVFDTEGGTIGGGSTVTPDPTPVGEAVYTSLLPTATECDWTFENVNMPEELTYIWAWKSYNDAYYLNGSAYANSTAYAAEALAISPVVDLTEVEAANLSFEHAAKFQTSLRTACGLQVREEGSEVWTALTIPTWPEAGSWAFVESGVINLDDYAGKKVEFAFKYGSLEGQADTWEIRNFTITAPTAVNSIEADVTPVYYDLQGRRVENPAAGLYVKVQGTKATKVFVK